MIGISAQDVQISGSMTRLHGCRRYDYMEVIGRVESGTEAENESGERIEEVLYPRP